VVVVGVLYDENSSFLRACSRFYPDLTPVYLDAHPYDTLFPNRWPNFHPPVEALPQAYS